jgi:hypothetical protein
MSLPDACATAKSSSRTVLPSVFDTHPHDLGGVYARQGFAYQDDVAAGFYLQMLKSSNLLEVSCETYDDILLVWQDTNDKVLEFVQVKAEHLDQLWTIAKLCERTKTPKNPHGIGSSILEKSLSRDQYNEVSRFRIVTCRQIDPQLIVLTREVYHEHRAVSYAPFKELAEEVGKRLPETKSKKGNKSLFWLSNAYWDVVAEGDIIRLNKQTLTEALYGFSLPYDPDTVQVIYDNLRALAKETAEFGIEKWKKKRISRDQLLALIRGWLDPYPDKGKTERLEQKFGDAGLDSVCFNAAKNQQRFYLQKKRSAGYYKTEQAEEIEQQVLDKLHTLRSSLDSGKIKINGAQFHDLCLTEVRGLQLSDESANNPLIPSYLAGCMYEITARCRHRFTRFQS